MGLLVAGAVADGLNVPGVKAAIEAATVVLDLIKV